MSINLSIKTTDEEWRECSVNPLYEISTLGNIRNRKNQIKKIFNIEKLKETKTRIRVNIMETDTTNKTKGYYLHRLVASTFIPNPNNLEEVNHINGNPYDNRVENLEWITRQENMKHFHDNNKFSKKFMRKLLLINKTTGETIDTYKCIQEYLEKTGSQVKYNKLYTILNGYKYTKKDAATCAYYEVDENTILKFEDNNNNVTYYNPEDNDSIIWKTIKEAPMYEVSNTGLIKHSRLNRIVKGYLINGYNSVNLKLNETENKKICRLVHRLVAEEFITNDIPDRIYVDHIDTNPLNNHVSNLRWVTPKENMNNETTKKNISTALLGHSPKIYQINIETGLVESEYNNCVELENQSGINYGTVHKILNFYKKGNVVVKDGSHQKTYNKKYIFLYEAEFQNKDKYIEIAKNVYSHSEKKTVAQINKDTNEIVNVFESMYDASKKLGIQYSGISQVYNYYKYDDNNRPACYKLKSTHGFIFKDTVDII
jgi:hypothetical protein